MDEGWRAEVRRRDGVDRAEMLEAWAELRRELQRAGFDPTRPALPPRVYRAGDAVVLEVAARFKWADVLELRDAWDARTARQDESAGLVAGLLERLDQMEADYAATLEVAAEKKGGALPLPSSERAAEASAIAARLLVAGFDTPAAARRWLSRDVGTWGRSLIRTAAPLNPQILPLLDARRLTLVAGYRLLLHLHGERLAAASLPKDATTYHVTANARQAFKSMQGRNDPITFPALWVLGWMLDTVVAADDPEQLDARREALLGAAG